MREYFDFDQNESLWDAPDAQNVLLLFYTLLIALLKRGFSISNSYTNLIINRDRD